ncbi:MAG TPA: copper-binding protein [Rubricoccaceae bacterium]
MRPLLLLALLSAGCSDRQTGPSETVEVRAVYERTVYDGAAATVDHEAIPGQMDAMRMDFPLADSALVAGLAPGAKVALTLQVEPRLEVLAAAPLPDTTRLALAER